MKNKNELQYEMIKPKRQGKLKLDTKEVRIVQKTKLRQELKRQRTSQKRFRRILYLIIAAAIVIYIAGTVYYSKHFIRKGTAFGIALRNESVASVKGKNRRKNECLHTYGIRQRWGGDHQCIGYRTEI